MQEIGLSKCSLTDEGVKAIADAISSSQTLTATSLAGNLLKDTGALAPAKALDRLLFSSPSLRIDLANNGVGNSGIAALKDVVLHKKGSVFVDLSAQRQ